MFLIHSDINVANFTDDDTQYLPDKYVEDVIESLERASISLFRWFENNLLKGNADKYCKKLLGVKYDSKLRFDQHITDLCRKASRKSTRTS